MQKVHFRLTSVAQKRWCLNESPADKTHFNRKGVALNFARNVRDFGTRKWSKEIWRFPATTSGMSPYGHVWFTYFTWWNCFRVLHPSTLNPTLDLNPDHVRNKVTADVSIVGFHIKDDPLIHSTITEGKRDSPRSWGGNHEKKMVKSKRPKCSHKWKKIYTRNYYPLLP